MATSTTSTQLPQSLPLVVVIAGPTGVGKSNVAANLCSSQKGMIISADSVQALPGVHIGANKPSASERAETPHLLLDVLDHSKTDQTAAAALACSSSYNAAEWQRDALYCIQELVLLKGENDDCASRTQPSSHSLPRRHELAAEMDAARSQKGYGKNEALLPVVVGGTMMYLQWLVHGRPDAVGPSEETVQRATSIMDGYRKDDQWDQALDFVSSFGELFAARTKQLNGQDWYRLRRTLEIAYTVQEKSDATLLDRLYSGERGGGLEQLGYDVRCFFLCPDDRMKHTEVVDRRCEDMIVRGLLKETAELESSNQLPAMAARAIGYRQSLDYLKREDFVENDGAAFDAFLNDFTTATRRYAKKQMQWFRKDGSFAFIPVPISAPKDERVAKAADAITRLCSMSRSEYEKELKSGTNEDGTVSISEQTKRTNEEQGKTMKFYQFKRHLIKPGSEVSREVMEQADECTRLIQRQATKKQRVV